MKLQYISYSALFGNLKHTPYADELQIIWLTMGWVEVHQVLTGVEWYSEKSVIYLSTILCVKDLVRC